MHCLPPQSFYGVVGGQAVRIFWERTKAYAFSVVEADYEEAGYDDVMPKLVRDFSVRCSEMRRMDIERELCRTYAVAARQVGATY
jgi:hypothetical protein